MTVTALILGVLALVFLALSIPTRWGDFVMLGAASGIVATVLGLIDYSRDKSNKQALVGWVLGVISIVLIIVFFDATITARSFG